MIRAGKLNLQQPPVKRRLIISENTRQLRRLETLISVSRHTADLLMRELDIPAPANPRHSQSLGSGFSAAHGIRARQGSQNVLWGSRICRHPCRQSQRLQKTAWGPCRRSRYCARGFPRPGCSWYNGPANREEGEFLAESGSQGAFQFLPALPEEGLRQFYGAADVLIFPSFYEGFGWPSRSKPWEPVARS